MLQPAIVAIGASSGGIAALQSIVADLEPLAPAIWCVVVHIDNHASSLPSILERAGPLPAQHARQGERLAAGRIHVAPPDLHLLVEDGVATLSRGPRENWTRPAIDPTFRSAARSYGRRTVGVVLTGDLNDGTAGLLAIRKAGGRAVVQDPREAVSPSMPLSALRQVGADHCVRLAEMPSLLCELARELASEVAHRTR